MISAAEKLTRTKTRYRIVSHGDFKTHTMSWDRVRVLKDRWFLRMNKVLARRILNAAREKNGIFISSSPGPGHTCEGTVAGSYTCKKCLTRKTITIPLNSWARLQDEKRAAAAAAAVAVTATAVDPIKKAKKAKACPHCGGAL